jgi:hypothetical protein
VIRAEINKGEGMIPSNINCAQQSSKLPIWRKGFLWAALAGCSVATAAQPAPPMLPGASPAPIGQGAYNYFYQSGLICGAGASTSHIATRPTVQCGGMLTMTPFFELEAGVMGPQSSASYVSGYLSTNLWIPLRSLQYSPKRRGLPFVSGGYTRMFETGHAMDYGIGYSHPLDESHSIRFEARDYWTFSNPHQHNVIFRFVWLVGLPD